MYLLVIDIDGAINFGGSSDKFYEVRAIMAAAFFDYFYGAQYSLKDFVNNEGEGDNWFLGENRARIEYGSQNINFRIIDTKGETEL